MSTDGLAIIEPQTDSTSLIRGSGILTVLGQFTWAVNDRAGVIIPTHKTGIARAALEAAGWTITAADDPPPQPTERQRRMPLPLPECEHCQAPYRRDYQVRLGDSCVRCGHHLTLVQHDPNADTASADTMPCPVCGRTVRRNWRFCPSGHELDEPQLDFGTPESRAERVRVFADHAFQIPDGS